MPGVHDSQTLDEKSRLLLDTWAERVFAAVHSADESILRIINDGAIPFKCAQHGWVGVFPCHAYGVHNRIPLVPVMDIVFQKSFPLDWSNSLQHFFLRIPQSYEGCEHKSSFKLD
eukprot:423136-Pleurochrysis_carterae.AAC.1